RHLWRGRALGRPGLVLRHRTNWPGNVRAHRRRLPELPQLGTDTWRMVPSMVVWAVQLLREIARAEQRAPALKSRQHMPVSSLCILGSPPDAPVYNRTHKVHGTGVFLKSDPPAPP